jgi:hypothetical protein
VGFVRRNRQGCGLFALAALALQFVVSFGHVHLDDLHLDNLRLGGLPAAHGTAQAATSTAASSDHQTPSPADDADDYCAICASIFLVSNSFTPVAPQLTVPGAFARIDNTIDVTRAVLAEPPRAAFRSRAPPRA